MALPVPAPSPTAPLRAWRVDLDPAHTWWSCTAPRCTGAERARGRRATVVALGHLAAHAAAEPLAAHLRPCRCHAHGCAWHPRHRGCQGPVALAVFRSAGGATWQLADACTACARAIPHAAQLPAPPAAAPTHRAEHRRTGPEQPAAPSDRQANAGLTALLTYLNAALVPGTPPAARLLALLCLLYADRSGHVELPAGLLRAWRLADRPALVDHLARQGWLLPLQQHADERMPWAAVRARIGDSAGTAVLHALGRRQRRRLAHQVSELLPRRAQQPAPQSEADKRLWLALHTARPPAASPSACAAPPPGVAP